MVIKRMSRSIRLISFFVLLKLLFFNNFTYASNEETFDVWLQSYKKYALSNGVAQNTINLAFKNVKFLDQVIKYDRKQ